MFKRGEMLRLTPSSSSSSSKMLSKSEMLTTRSFSRVSEGLGFAAPSSGSDCSETIKKKKKNQPQITLEEKKSRDWTMDEGENDDDAAPGFGAELNIDIASFPSGSAPLLVISSP